jgi:alkylation response protein AidB-like acyl-CoA dehydrogenase
VQDPRFAESSGIVAASRLDGRDKHLMSLFSLSSDHTSLRDAACAFAREHLADDVTQRDRDQEFSRELWNRCGEWGMQGLPVPEAYGGKGYDPLSTAVVLEGLGHGCADSGLAFSITAHLLACVVPVWKHGSEFLKERFLPDLCSGKLIAVNAMTEPQTGSDAFAMKTTATASDGGFVINGTKTLATNGPIADVALMYAMTDPVKGYFGGVTAFLVDIPSAGLTVGPNLEKSGLRTVPFGELQFCDCFVPADRIVGQVGGGAAIFAESMDWERGLLGAIHVGTMQRLLDQATRHAKTRKQFGQAIGKFQAVSHRLADMKVRLEAARLLVYQTACKLESSRSVSLDAAITKLFVSESLMESAIDTVRTLGGWGILTTHQVERALRDSVASTLYSGTSDLQRNLIARWMGL